jgi:hypothetical protein
MPKAQNHFLGFTLYIAAETAIACFFWLHPDLVYVTALGRQMLLSPASRMSRSNHLSPPWHRFSECSENVILQEVTSKGSGCTSFFSLIACYIREMLILVFTEREGFISCPCLFQHWRLDSMHFSVAAFLTIMSDLCGDHMTGCREGFPVLGYRGRGCFACGAMHAGVAGASPAPQG